MQSTHGNAHVARLLAQQRAGVLGRMPIRRGAGHGSLAEAETAQVYEQPSESSKVVGKLAKGKTVDLTSDDGGFYGVVFDATRAMSRAASWRPRSTSCRRPRTPSSPCGPRRRRCHRRRRPRRGQGPARDWHRPGRHGGGALPDWFRQLQFKLSMVTTWAKEEEDAQQVLDDYMTYYMEAWHGDLPPSLKYLFQFAGRSSINQGSAAQGRLRERGQVRRRDQRQGQAQPQLVHADELLGDRQRAARHGLRADHAKIEQFLSNIAFQKSAGRPNTISGSAAFTAPLYPGDQVMYLFDGCQYGGHTVTVVDDLGDSFLHISGNTGDAIAVGIGEAQRLKSDPKVKGGGTFKLAECNKVASAEERDASTAYIKGLDFGGKVLTYSIIRDSAFFAEIESIPSSPRRAEQAARQVQAQAHHRLDLARSPRADVARTPVVADDRVLAHAVGRRGDRGSGARGDADVRCARAVGVPEHEIAGLDRRCDTGAPTPNCE